MGRVLLVDDDEMLTFLLEQLFREEGLSSEIVQSGTTALEVLRTGTFDLLLLDLGLPDMDGLSLLRQVREAFGNVPVLVLTARDQSRGLLPALELGADDCMLKPFSYRELLARIRNILRRGNKVIPVISQCGNLVLDREQMSVKRGNRQIALTRREYSLLEFLMRTPQVPVSRDCLLNEVWGDGLALNTNIVDVYVKYIRDKVDQGGEPRLVQTVRGIGYSIALK